MTFEVLWGHPNHTTPIDVHEVPIPIAGLPPQLEGFRLAMVADLHYGQLVDAAYARRVVDLVNDQQPDVIVLLGDLVDTARRQLAPCARIVSALRARVAVVACLGNHEHAIDIDAAISEYRRAGIDVLVNAHTRLTINGADLIVAGLDDRDCGHPDPAAALAGLDGRDPVIVLCHNPDQAEHLRHAGRVDLMLCGHTHGGQVTLWGFPPITQTRHRKYASGLNIGPRCPVYTTRGLGVTRLPLRICCRPEIPIIRLTAAPVASSE